MADLQALTKPVLADKAINGHDPGANQAFWLVAGTDSNKDYDWWFGGGPSASEFALFDVVQVRYYWSQIEGTGDGGSGAGDYDFSRLRASLDFATETGIPVCFFIMERKFNWNAYPGPEGDTEDVTPPDLVADYQYGLTASAPAGPVAAMYESIPSGRYRACLKAIIDEFKDHPYFVGVGPGETAGQRSTVGGSTDPQTETTNSLTYTVSKYTSALNAKHIDVAGHCDYVYYIPGWNFLTNATALSAAESAWIDVWNNVPTDNVVTWTPDIIPDNGSNSGIWKRVFPILSSLLNGSSGTDGVASSSAANAPIRNYRRGSSLQNDSHKASVIGAGTTMRDLIELGGGQSTNELELDLIFVTYQPYTGGSWTYNFHDDTAPAVSQGWPAP